jgi:hypothetical protein
MNPLVEAMFDSLLIVRPELAWKHRHQQQMLRKAMWLHLGQSQSALHSVPIRSMVWTCMRHLLAEVAE